MGRILKYVVILSNLSLIIGVQIYKDPSQGHNYGREKRGNFTSSIRQPMGESEKLLPLGFQGRKRPPTTRPGHVTKSLGLQAFASENIDSKVYKRNFSEQRFRNQQKRLPPFSQTLYPRSNSKRPFSGDYHEKVFTSQKLSRLLNQNHSINNQINKTEENRRHYYHGRNGRHHQRLAKICDPCNSVPWVPLLKVPDSYRQHRTHITELHPTPQQNFNFDYHTFASNTQNVLLPPVPLVPPLEPIYDGTISSSFGLPVGNIPTSHGLLAPINHLAPTVNKYGGDSLDYSSSFGFFPTQDLLQSNPFPELSPVPIVPIHDSGQFYNIDSSIPDLVPPPKKPIDVSNIVLTIAENDPSKQSSGKPNRDVGSNLGYHNSQSTTLHKVPSQSTDYKPGKLEIVKSVPVAEFTTSNDYPRSQSNLPLYPPLQSEPPNKYHNHKEEPADQKSANDQSSYNILAPPKKPIHNENENKPSNGWSDRPREPAEASTVPKPLTSPSLSWLFSDHTAPPEFKSTASIPSFVTEAKELASVVNSGLQPVSNQPLPVSSTGVDASKSKKIQIIIPYTTKSKNGYDNNALESVQHEIFQPLVSESTFENNLSRDLASSTHTFPPNRVPETKANRGEVIDGSEIDKPEDQPDNDDTGKYLSEMHHIIASNIRELLREEIEKTQNDQNYPLQNSIDNWTALEYSNHKTVEAKAPKEIITQALAVTSIPGTSISHLLLPSKKIPNEYFITTPTPVYDEPSRAVYKATNTTVNSRPFTAKPYATTNVYVPTTTFRDNNKQNKENSHRDNHEKNYTEVERGRVNNWGRLNENLVLPEPRSKSRIVTPIASTTSPTAQAPAWTSRIYASDKKEKVQIVTPVSVTANRTQTSAFRRTTRHVLSSELPTTVTPAVTSTVNLTQKPLFIRKLNSTKLEKISNSTLPFNRKFSLGKLTTRTTTTSTTTATTATPKSVAENSTKTVLVLERTKQLVTVKESDVKTNTTGSPNVSNVNFSKTQQISINDIFPFRNKELPWESNSTSSEHNFRVGRQRKSLIKQANLPKPKAADVSS